jgi:hypothetical protein
MGTMRLDGRLSQFAKFSAPDVGKFRLIGWGGGETGVQWSEGDFDTRADAISHIKKLRDDPSASEWRRGPLVNFFVFDDHGRHT